MLRGATRRSPPVSSEYRSSLPVARVVEDMNILVVDDSENARKYLAFVLIKHGHDVVIAEDAEQAWAQLQKTKIQLVLCDWVMPGTSGIELCRRIRQSGLPHYVYVIMVTGRTTPSDLVEGMNSGADDFVTKPFRVEELNARIGAAARILVRDRDLFARNEQLSAANDIQNQNHDVIKKDLEAASNIQKQLLPGSTRVNSVSVSSLFCPAAFVAGDVFNIVRLDDRRLAFFHIDVSGHGVASAMLSYTLNSILCAAPADNGPINGPAFEFEWGNLSVSPAELVTRLNRRFQHEGREHKLYFTMVYGILDSFSGRGQLCQAGHPAPFQVSRTGRVSRLGDGGFPVGLIEGARFENRSFQLRPGDRLFVYSDGISDCPDRVCRPFGDERLRRYLGDAGAARVPMTELLQGLESRLMNWRQESEFSDDMSLLALEMDDADQPRRASCSPTKRNSRSAFGAGKKMRTRGIDALMTHNL